MQENYMRVASFLWFLHFCCRLYSKDDANKILRKKQKIVYLFCCNVKKSLLSVMVSKNVDYLKETAFSRSTATPTPALLLSSDLFVPFVVLVELVRTIVFRMKTRSQACHTSPIFGLTVFWHHSSGAEPLRIGPQRPVQKNRSSVDFETQFSSVFSSCSPCFIFDS